MEKIVTVDINSNFRVFERFENGLSPIEIDKETIGWIKDVSFAYSFHDPTFMKENEAIWFV